MTKKLILLLALFVGINSIHAQTKEELKSQKAEKQAAADALQGEANALQAQIDALPGWRIGAFGTVGGSLSEFSNWYSQGTPNNSAGSIGFTVNAFANKIEDGFAHITISDTGIGMSDDEVEVALEQFGQVQSTYSRNFQGTGLGLPLVYKFMDVLGGKINAADALKLEIVTITYTAKEEIE